MRVLTNVFTCTYTGKYDVLAEVFTRKYSHVYGYLLDIRIIKILLLKFDVERSIAFIFGRYMS